MTFVNTLKAFSGPKIHWPIIFYNPNKPTTKRQRIEKSNEIYLRFHAIQYVFNKIHI